MKELDEQLQRLRTLVAEPQWAANVDAQYLLVQFLASHPARTAGVDHLEHYAANRLGITLERFKALQALTDPRLIRRALRSRSLTSHEPRYVPSDSVGSYPDTGWLGAYLTYARESEVPVGWHFWCGVALLGAACRRQLYLDRNQFFVFPNHYLLLVGPTAARKSTAIEIMETVLGTFNDMLLEEAKDTGTDLRIVQLPSIITPEALIDTLKPCEHDLTNGRAHKITRPYSAGILTNDELSTLLGKNVKGSDRLVHHLTRLYSFQGTHYRTSTRAHGERTLVEPVLTCVFGSTAEWISRSMTTDMVAGGFVGRCLLLERERSREHFPKPGLLDPVVGETLARWLLRWATMPLTEVRLNEGAEAWFADWHIKNREAKAPIPIMEGWKERKQGHLLRLAIVLALSELSGTEVDATYIALDDATLALANDLLTREEARMPETFVRIGQHEDTELIDEVLAMLRRLEGKAGGAPVSRAKWYGAVRFRVGDARNFGRIVEALVEAGEIEAVRIEPGPLGGRPGSGYSTRPTPTPPAPADTVRH